MVHPPEAMMAVSVASSSTASVGSMNTCAAEQWWATAASAAACVQFGAQRRMPTGGGGHPARCVLDAPARRGRATALAMSMGVMALRVVLCVRSSAPFMMATSSAQQGSRGSNGAREEVQ